MVINIRRYLPVAIILLISLCVIIILYKITQVDSNKEIPKEIPKAETEMVSPYGEFLSWDQVNPLFPKHAKATVIDLDTGSNFRVQRRGGTYHADVQPLTAEDTAVMKAIYNDKWSWQRKAVIVQLDNGRRIAASMNGMPHGGGSIRGNNFIGHSCIHFRDSKTHGTRKINLAHQIMVWKAANKVNEQLQTLTPEKTIEVFFTAVDQGEVNIAGEVVDADTEDAALLLKGVLDIESVRVHGIDQIDRNNFTVCVGVVYQGSSEEYVKNLELKLTQSKNHGWIINSQTMLPLLEQVNNCC